MLNALSSTAPTIRAARTGSDVGVGNTSSPASTVTAMTMTLAIVPMPGRLRSGIHASSTATQPLGGADRHSRVPGQTLMEHVPRVEAQARTHHHRHREAVSGQPDEQRGSRVAAGISRVVTGYAWSGSGFESRPALCAPGGRRRHGRSSGWPGTDQLNKAARPVPVANPIRAHSSIIGPTGLPFNSQLAHTGLEMTVEPAARALDADLLARELGNWRTSNRSGPAYKGLADGIRMLIIDGRLPVGARLPSERTLAALCGCPAPVTAAYAHLRDDGYLNARRGARSTTAVATRSTADAAPASASVNLAIAALPHRLQPP